MKTRHIQYGICLLYSGFFVADCLLLRMAWIKFFVDLNDYQKLSGDLTDLYKVPFLLLFAFIFGTKKQADAPISWWPLVMTLLFIIPWNLFVAWPFWYLAFSAGPQGMSVTEWVNAYWNGIPATLGAYAGSCLVYLFLKSAGPKAKSDDTIITESKPEV